MAFAADGGFAMARQRHRTAENVAKLRQVDELARVARARFVVKRVNGQVEAEFGARFMHVRGTIKMPSDVWHTRPRHRSDIPPRNLRAGSGSTDGDSDASSSGGKITRSTNFVRGSLEALTPDYWRQRYSASSIGSPLAKAARFHSQKSEDCLQNGSVRPVKPSLRKWSDRLPT